MTAEALLPIIVFGPLAGAIIAGLFGTRLGAMASQAVTTGLLVLSAVLSWVVFSQWTWGGLEPVTLTLAPFISNWSIRLDGLSAVMLVVVTTVSALVHVYSWGYMAEDPSRPRFFAYLSLFTFAMLALVTAADFMQLFFGWEGVGLASYLLIGFWHHKDSANAAAIKAFVVNRVGDFGFALGIMTVFWMFGSIQFAEVFSNIDEIAGSKWRFIGYDWSAVDLACGLLFIGAMGKSAQFFLHTWLPDAMEGPTPVSALIHAATMVTAGVYMVCLLSPMFEVAPVARDIVTVIGAVTALFAATVGLAQNDIKRVIAYSTCSQLGYMFFAAGVGAYQAAMFHLFTHAFFKALLFLGAGSVIHGMHHEQDMRRMGGLWRYLPVTYAVMTIGTLAITGFGIPSLHLGLAGFYSKDTIIEAAWKSVENRVTSYMVAFLLLEALVIGVFCALDLVLFYVFFEFGLAPMFLIIGIWGGKRRVYAAFKFFLYTLLGSVLMLAAVLAMIGASGTSSIPDLMAFRFEPWMQTWLWLAFFASFAVKMPMWPVHTWLPDAHVEAPTAGSVILAGILLKMGGYGFLRFSLPMFPDASQAFAPLVFALSAIAIIYTSLVAFRQTDIKKLIAYSSVAHMGFVTMGIFSFDVIGVQGAIFQMLSHGVISGALFLCVGVVYDRMHTREIAFYGGLVKRMPVFAAVFLLFTMGNVGLPGTSGFVGEIMTLTGVYFSSTWTALAATTGVILSAVYALSLYRRVVLGEMTNPALAEITDMDWREMLIFAPLVIATLWLGFQPGLVFNITASSVDGLLGAFRTAVGH